MRQLLVGRRRQAQVLLHAVRVDEHEDELSIAVDAVEHDVHDVDAVTRELHDQDQLGQLERAVVQMALEDVDFLAELVGRARRAQRVALKLGKFRAVLHPAVGREPDHKFVGHVVVQAGVQHQAVLAAVGARPRKERQVFDAAARVGVVVDVDAGPQLDWAVFPALRTGEGILTGFGHNNNPFSKKLGG